MRTIKVEGGYAALWNGFESAGHRSVVSDPRIVCTRQLLAWGHGQAPGGIVNSGRRAGGEDLLPSARHLPAGVAKARTFNPHGLTCREVTGVHESTGIRPVRMYAATRCT